MAKQRYINTKVWTDGWFMDLDATEKLLFLYLLTNPNTNIAGVYEISMRQIAFDTNIDQEALKRLFGRFEDAGKVYFELGWVVIKNFVKHQSRNPKVDIGIRAELDSVPAWLKQRLTDKEDRLYIAYDSLVHSNLNSNLIKFNSNSDPNGRHASVDKGKGDREQLGRRMGM